MSLNVIGPCFVLPGQAFLLCPSSICTWTGTWYVACGHLWKDFAPAPLTSCVQGDPAARQVSGQPVLLTDQTSASMLLRFVQLQHKLNNTTCDSRGHTSGERSRTGLLDLDRSAGDGDLGKGDGERSRGDRSSGEPPAAPLTGDRLRLGLRLIVLQGQLPHLCQAQRNFDSAIRRQLFHSILSSCHARVLSSKVAGTGKTLLLMVMAAYLIQRSAAFFKKAV